MVAMREPLRAVTDYSLMAMEKATAAYEQHRWLADELLTRRGISSETASAFRVGVAAIPEPGHEAYRGWLAIPYLGLSVTGEEQVWAIRFRCIEDHNCKDYRHGKYATVAGEQARMFNTRAIRQAADEMHVTEGEIDAMILTQAGYPAVAMPGASSWKPHHAKTLAGFERVYVWGDPDDAGREFVAAVRKTLGRSGRTVHMRDGDVNETFLAGGKHALDELYKEANLGR